MGHEPVDQLLKERPCGWALRGTRLLTSGRVRDDALRAARWRSVGPNVTCGCHGTCGAQWDWNEPLTFRTCFAPDNGQLPPAKKSSWGATSTSAVPASRIATEGVDGVGGAWTGAADGEMCRVDSSIGGMTLIETSGSTPGSTSGRREGGEEAGGGVL